MAATLWMVAFFLGTDVYGQARINTSEIKIDKEEITEYERNGKVLPIFWKCVIGRKAAMVPFEQVTTVLLHDYVVDGQIYVKEFTLVLTNETFIRIYYSEKLDVLSQAGKAIYKEIERVETMGTVTMGLPPITPTLDLLGDSRVVKNYPTTTHLKMVEYRVPYLKSVDELYENFEMNWLEYTAWNLIADHRPLCIRVISVPAQ